MMMMVMTMMMMTMMMMVMMIFHRHERAQTVFNGLSTFLLRSPPTLYSSASCFSTYDNFNSELCDPEVLLQSFYPRDAMLARSLRQRRVRLSVRPSVTRRYCAKTVHFRHKVTMRR